MTTSSARTVTLANRPAQPTRVSWAATVTMWRDPFDICRRAGRRYATVELIVEFVQPTSQDGPLTAADWSCDALTDTPQRAAIPGMLNAWLDLAIERRPLRVDLPVIARIDTDQGHVHVDLDPQVMEPASAPTSGAAGSLLRATFDQHGELLFARSMLLEAAGFVGGRYDPPRGVLRCPVQAAGCPPI